MDHIARRYTKVSDPIAAMIFFAPEAQEAYQGFGMNWFEGYFCSRSAAFGHWTSEIVISTFYNFGPDHVRRAVEGGRGKASPADVAEARFVAAGAAMRRMLTADGAAPDITRALDLQWKLVGEAPPQGRPLYAAHLAEPRRQDPFEAMWQASNLMREFRGDGHIAVLVAHDIGPVEALLLHAPMLGIPAEGGLMRGPREWPADAVAAAKKSLGERGLYAGDAPTEEGTAMRARIEDQTDEVSAAPFRALGAEADELLGLLQPLADAVAAGARRR